MRRGAQFGLSSTVKGKMWLEGRNAAVADAKDTAQLYAQVRPRHASRQASRRCSAAYAPRRKQSACAPAPSQQRQAGPPRHGRSDPLPCSQEAVLG